MSKSLMNNMPDYSPIIEVKNLTILHRRPKSGGFLPHFRLQAETGYLVNNVSMVVSNNRVHGVVGESGSGKSLTAKSILGLVDCNPGIVGGEISYYDELGKRITIFSAPSITQVGHQPSSKYSSYRRFKFTRDFHEIQTLLANYRDYSTAIDLYVLQKNGEWKIQHHTINPSDESLPDIEEGKNTRYIFVYREWSTYSSARSIAQIENRQKELGLRGNIISMILQDPNTFLNPYWSIEKQIRRRLRHVPEDYRTPEDPTDIGRIKTILGQVDLDDQTGKFRESYPRQLSGGQGQRVMIALALAGKPRLLIADEPTTGLDVTKQLDIIDLFGQLSEANRTSIVISHDINFLRNIADEYTIMYAGFDLEHASREAILNKDKIHPYTARLVEIADAHLSERSGSKTNPYDFISKEVPDPYQSEFRGCPFANRCHKKDELAVSYGATLCENVLPPLIDVDNQTVDELTTITRTSGIHLVRCWLYFSGEIN